MRHTVKFGVAAAAALTITGLLAAPANAGEDSSTAWDSVVISGATKARATVYKSSNPEKLCARSYGPSGSYAVAGVYIGFAWVTVTDAGGNTTPTCQYPGGLSPYNGSGQQHKIMAQYVPASGSSTNGPGELFNWPCNWVPTLGGGACKSL